MEPHKNRLIGLTILMLGLGTACGFADSVTFASDESQTALLELFTSEGCSSCPPAEAWLSRLKSNPGLWRRIVPVAFHVDYWDNLGWRDRFSQSVFTERQRRYARSWRSDSVYTPGFVLNGREWRGWGEALPTSTAKPGALSIITTGRRDLTGTFVAHDAPPSQSLTLEVALLGGNVETDVKRGENSGRKLRHDFVALHLATADMVKKENSWTASVSLPQDAGNKSIAIAAWVKPAGDGAPIQATGGWLTSQH